MDKNRVMEAMEHIDPALVEGADVERPRVRSAWHRPAIIAACLCLVLAGTAVAAELAGVNISDFLEGQMDFEGETRGFVGYDYIVKGIRRISVDSLDPGVMEHIEETRESDGFYNINKAVYSKEQAEEFLGLHLADNSVLAQAYSGTFGFYAGDNAGLKGEPDPYCARHTGAPGYIRLAGTGRGLEDIEVSLSYMLHLSDWTVETENGWQSGTSSMNIYVKAEIYTDVKDESVEEDGVSCGIRYTVSKELEESGFAVNAGEQFTYTTPGGLEAVIASTVTTGGIDYKGDPQDSYDYTAYFVLDGIFYTIQGFYYDQDVCLETMYEILDAYGQEAVQP